VAEQSDESLAAYRAQRHEGDTITRVKSYREQHSDSTGDESTLVLQQSVSDVTWLHHQTNEGIRNCKAAEQQIGRRL